MNHLTHNDLLWLWFIQNRGTSETFPVFQPWVGALAMDTEVPFDYGDGPLDAPV
jgi:hypothetical protein